MVSQCPEDEPEDIFFRTTSHPQLGGERGGAKFRIFSSHLILMKLGTEGFSSARKTKTKIVFLYDPHHPPSVGCRRRAKSRDYFFHPSPMKLGTEEFFSVLKTKPKIIYPYDPLLEHSSTLRLPPVSRPPVPPPPLTSPFAVPTWC